MLPVTTSLTRTRAVRAGLEMRRDRRGGAAASSLVDLCLPRLRRQAQVRLHAARATRRATCWRDALADLEGGAGAVVTGSGMAAITLVGHLLPVGARVIAPHDCYGGTLSSVRPRGRSAASSRWNSWTSATRPRSRAALSKPAALVWIETPSNPLLRITDIADVAERAHAAGALVVVDNTFLSPGWQQPLALGADIVVHSTTKYLNGHSDVVGGAVIAAKKELARAAGLVGQLPRASPARRSTATSRCAACARCMRGCASTARTRRRLAELLPQQSAVKQSTTRACRLTRATRSPRASSAASAPWSVRSCRRPRWRSASSTPAKCFTLAESLGGVESLVAHPATMTHAAMDPKRARPRASPTRCCACRSASKPSRICCATCRTASRRWVSSRRASHAAGDWRCVAPGGRDFATLAVHVVRPRPVGE